MTLDEKISLMHGQQPFWPGLATMLAPGGYSSRVWIAGEVTRLGIPGIRFSDGLRGVVMEGATTFPVSMARGATWDTALEERVGEVIGRELRALGGNYFGSVEATSKWRIEPIGYTAIVGRHAVDPNALRTDFRVV